MEEENASGVSIINVAPPECFNFDKPEGWITWKKRFERFITVSGANKKTEAEKIDVLIYIMGEKSEEILLQFPNLPATLNATLEQFDKYFVPQRNIIFSRFKFNSRFQKQGESIDSFITDLHTLAGGCDYGDLHDELIRDRIVVGMLDTRLSEAMQLKSELTLKDAIAIARQSEIQHKQNKIIRAESSDVNAIKSFSKHNKSNSNNATKPKCNYCGGSVHDRQKCPARESTCFSCKVKGHFSKMCRKRGDVSFNGHSSKHKHQGGSGKQSASGNSSTKSSGAHPDNKIRLIHVSDSDFIGNVNDKINFVDDEWVIPVKICEFNCTIEFLVDTGSGHVCLPTKCIPKNYLDKVNASSFKLFGPDGGDLGVMGTLNLSLIFKNIVYKSRVFIVDKLSQPLLGRSAIKSFQILNMSFVNQIKSSINVREEFPTLFNQIGEFKGEVEIRLKSDNVVPYVQSVPRIVPVGLLGKLEKEIHRLESQGIIEKIQEATEWVSPIVVVPKGNEIRLCVDYTKLNKCVMRPFFPISKVEATLSKLSGAKFFSKIDMNKGFYQIKLAKESQKLTCFISPFGRFIFKRLPFGISCAPEYFVTKFSNVLLGIKNIVFHIDDVLVFADTIEKHDETLRLVLERLKNEGITINESKSQFGVSEIEYLGHKLSANGISVSTSRIDAIVNFPRPDTKVELQRFLGCMNFVGRYIENRSDILEPLHELLKKDVVYDWNDHHEKSFKQIKEMIVKTPTLAFFDPSKQIIVSADASSYGLGACLQQMSNNQREIVAYVSRSMTSTERQYAQIEREALALTWALEKFSEYVIGLNLILETDHKPLLQILQTKDIDTLTPRLQRFRLRLMRYDYVVKYVPGKELVIADCLSRSPLAHTNDSEELTEELDAYCNFVKEHFPIKDAYLIKIKESQQNDQICLKIIEFTINEWPNRNQIPFELLSYYQYRQDFSMIDGLLLFNNRVVIPGPLQKEVLDFIHCGHQGIVKCRRRSQMSVWWLGLSTQLEILIRNCPNCIEYRKNPKEEFFKESIATRPMEKVALDLYKCRNSWYLIFTDYYSKYFEIRKLSSMTEEDVIDVVKDIFSRFGICDVLRSDNGPQFKSKFSEFARHFNFVHELRSPHHSQANGAAEAAVKIAKSLINKNDDVKLALLSYRTTPLENGFTPAELMLGRKIKSLLPMLPEKLNFPEKSIQQEVLKREEKIKDNQAKMFNKRHRAKNLSILEVGSHVWVVDLRQYGIVIKKLKYPRSYLVEVNSKEYRRNRWHLIPAPFKEHDDSKSLDSYSNRELPLEFEFTNYDRNPNEFIPIAEDPLDLQELNVAHCPSNLMNDSNSTMISNESINPNNSNIDAENHSLNTVPHSGRIRRPPTWLRDYVIDTNEINVNEID